MPLDPALLKRVAQLEARRTPVVWIPPDRSSFVPGQGFRVAIVVAGEAHYHLTGTWPYSGQVNETMPWFWGPTLADAERIAQEQNERGGITREEATLIVARSMARSTKRSGR